MTHTVTKIPKKRKRNVMIEGPTHLVVGPESRTTACGLSYGPKPALPYTLAKHRATIDKARIDGALPPVDWCPACLAHFGWRL